MSESQFFRASEIQKFRNSEIQKFRNPEIQKSRNSEIQKFRNSEIQKFRNSEIQKFRNSEIQKFRNLEIQKSRNSEIQKFRNSDFNVSNFGSLQSTFLYFDKTFHSLRLSLSPSLFLLSAHLEKWRVKEYMYYFFQTAPSPITLLLQLSASLHRSTLSRRLVPHSYRFL
ncbi:Protein CBG18801 [Caenorhabditis briggsae]|uniref:Protein CBG18801 n=1 Tax=Caenorhabditis briggsae TaxID=6238 RepID=A8XU51_CAEBR|nr:Protein CBG18801 [Caenorhabditis briggsae]CAP36176.1 Protein CBG18801 [Caenorhabditis briggsae]